MLSFAESELAAATAAVAAVAAVAGDQRGGTQCCRACCASDRRPRCLRGIYSRTPSRSQLLLVLRGECQRCDAGSGWRKRILQPNFLAQHWAQDRARDWREKEWYLQAKKISATIDGTPGTPLGSEVGPCTNLIFRPGFATHYSRIRSQVANRHVCDAATQSSRQVANRHLPPPFSSLPLRPHLNGQQLVRQVLSVA